VLDDDWTHEFGNLLFSFLYKLTGWPEMARKHEAIAKVQRMRSLGSLAPKNNLPKNFRTQAIELKVEIINYQHVKTQDQSLNSKENDNLFMDLVNFLLGKSVFNVADIGLESIVDKNSVRYLYAQSKIRVLQNRYADATKLLDQLLKISPQDMDGWTLRGHAFYLMGNLFDSEESYINALRIRSEKTKAAASQVSPRSSTNLNAPKGKAVRKGQASEVK